MKRLLIVFLLLVSTPALAVMNPAERLNNPAMEARAKDLTRTLRCVVCQNQSVDDSNAQIAQDLRITVRKQILDGKTDDQIRTYLRERYGDYILLDPPVEPRTWVLWFAPIVVLVAGMMLALATFARRRR